MADDYLAIGKETLINQEAHLQWSTKTHLLQLCGVLCAAFLFLCAVCRVSCVVCRVSRVLCRGSCVACRVSCVACRALRPKLGGEAAAAESLTSLRRCWEASSEQLTSAKCIEDKHIKSCATPMYGRSVRAGCGNDCDVSLPDWLTVCCLAFSFLGKEASSHV